MYSTYDLKEGRIRISSKQELSQIDALADTLPTKTIVAEKTEKYVSIQSECTKKVTETLFRTETGGILLHRMTQPTKEYFNPGYVRFEIIECNRNTRLEAKDGGSILLHEMY